MRSVISGMMAACLLAVTVLTSPIAALAHEGHDHGAPPPPVTATIAPRADASSSDFELVVVARGSELIIHLDDFRTNAPVTGADIEIDTSAGQLKPVAKGDGVYAATAPFVEKPGSYDLAITVSANGLVDILAATLTIPERAEAAAATASRSWLTDAASAESIRRQVAQGTASLWLAILAGFGAGVLATLLIRRRSASAASLIMLALGAATLPAGEAVADAPTAASATVTGAGRDVAQRMADGALFVPKTTQRILAIRTLLTEERAYRRSVELPGRIIPSPNASGLVQASVGGRLSPPPGGFKPLGTYVKAGEVLAYVRPPLPLADATSQQQQARELDQQISIVSRKVERLRAIERVIARSQLEDAELELMGLQTRRANLERVQREPEKLLAPVDGVIATSNAVAGQMAEPNAVIMQIVDPDVLWIEALSYEAQAIDGPARAMLSDGRAVDLEYIGSGFADRNQAVPIHFAIREKMARVRAGQFVTVLASTADERRGMAVPRAAVLRATNGQSLVWEHSNAERFVAREVRVEPLDGSRVLIVAGVEAGRRVVTQGAELLNQIR